MLTRWVGGFPPRAAGVSESLFSLFMLQPTRLQKVGAGWLFSGKALSITKWSLRP